MSTGSSSDQPCTRRGDCCCCECWSRRKLQEWLRPQLYNIQKWLEAIYCCTCKDKTMRIGTITGTNVPSERDETLTLEKTKELVIEESYSASGPHHDETAQLDKTKELVIVEHYSVGS